MRARSRTTNLRDTLLASSRAALVVALLAAGPLAAEVTLTTQVQRVVTIDQGTGAGMETLEAVTDVAAGDVVRYTIVFQNDSEQDVAAGSVVITNPLPEGTVYVDGSATGENTTIAFSVDGEAFGEPGLVPDATGTRPATAAEYRSIRWTYHPRLPAGASGEVSFDVRMR